MAIRVDIGIFAHNEAAGIAAMLGGMMAQDLHRRKDVSVRVLVLANGCTDETAARAALPGVEVVNLTQPGKSRTWNRFVHDLARREADVLIFADADIALPRPDTLSRLIDGLTAGHGLRVISSQPVKDIVANPEGLGVVERMIAQASGGLDDWRSAVCGQLYAMPAGAARRYHLPVGLPVEDGFLRAMVLTDAFGHPEDLTLIGGAEGALHLYPSERRVGPLIRHQVRIVIGSAVNHACFEHMRALPVAERLPELARAAADDGWLPRVVRARLPRWPYGYVPVHFLVKRLARADWRRIRRWPMLIAGFGFDLIVYLNAQVRMARGSGAGFW